MLRQKPCLLFSSYHNYLDFSSGAVVGLHDLFRQLRKRGWDCRVFCGPQFDYWNQRAVSEVIGELGLPVETGQARLGNAQFPVYRTEINGIPVVTYDAIGTEGTEGSSPAEQYFHLSLFRQAIQDLQPDLLLTFGGQNVNTACMQIARSSGIAVVFWLRNFAYEDDLYFRDCDGIIVPSQFSKHYYQDALGLSCDAIPTVIDWSRIEVSAVDRRYLTFINPIPEKGLFVVSGLFRELIRRRPDIPLLVVEGRGEVELLREAGLSLSELDRVSFLRCTSDTREFYSISRAVLMPSLWEESFGRVVVESMRNGIPVLASDRGALPEVMGSSDFLFSIPEHYTPATRGIPTPEELSPWLETISRLWDDEPFYAKACEQAKARSAQWDPERLAIQHEEVFLRLIAKKECSPSVA